MDPPGVLLGRACLARDDLRGRRYGDSSGDGVRTRTATISLQLKALRRQRDEAVHHALAAGRFEVDL